MGSKSVRNIRLVYQNKAEKWCILLVFIIRIEIQALCFIVSVIQSVTPTDRLPSICLALRGIIAKNDLRSLNVYSEGYKNYKQKLKFQA